MSTNSTRMMGEESFDGPQYARILRSMWLDVREDFTFAQGNAIFGAVLDLMFTGQEPTRLPVACRSYFKGIEPSLVRYRQKAVNGLRAKNPEGVTFATAYAPSNVSPRKNATNLNQNCEVFSSENATKNECSTALVPAEMQSVPAKVRGKARGKNEVNKEMNETINPSPSYPEQSYDPLSSGESTSIDELLDSMFQSATEREGRA